MKSHKQAALREFEEETGVSVNSRQLLGNLSELFIPPSNFLVKPFVAYATEPPCFDPDPVEVEEIIELLILTLMSDLAVKRGQSVPEQRRLGRDALLRSGRPYGLGCNRNDIERTQGDFARYVMRKSRSPRGAWACLRLNVFGPYAILNIHNQVLTLNIETAVPNSTVLAAVLCPRWYMLANR